LAHQFGAPHDGGGLPYGATVARSRPFRWLEYARRGTTRHFNPRYALLWRNNEWLKIHDHMQLTELWTAVLGISEPPYDTEVWQQGALQTFEKLVGTVMHSRSQAGNHGGKEASRLFEPPQTSADELAFHAYIHTGYFHVRWNRGRTSTALTRLCDARPRAVRYRYGPVAAVDD